MKLSKQGRLIETCSQKAQNSNEKIQQELILMLMITPEL
jgi:hypothetical protein